MIERIHTMRAGPDGFGRYRIAYRIADGTAHGAEGEIVRDTAELAFADWEIVRDAHASGWRERAA